MAMVTQEWAAWAEWICNSNRKVRNEVAKGRVMNPALFLWG